MNKEIDIEKLSQEISQAFKQVLAKYIGATIPNKVVNNIEDEYLQRNLFNEEDYVTCCKEKE